VRVDEYDLTDLVRRIRHPEQQLDGIIIGDQLVRGCRSWTGYRGGWWRRCAPGYRPFAVATDLAQQVEGLVDLRCIASRSACVRVGPHDRPPMRGADIAPVGSIGESEDPKCVDDVHGRILAPSTAPVVAGFDVSPTASTTATGWALARCSCASDSFIRSSPRTSAENLARIG
tara:strand:+ start:1622 stop:2140 length:519 start_codon:yes stop_codon:yes gene_type:complete